MTVRTFVSFRCVCGDCWCGQCPHCLQTVTRHNIDRCCALVGVQQHIRIAHPEKMTR